MEQLRNAWDAIQCSAPGDPDAYYEFARATLNALCELDARIEKLEIAHPRLKDTPVLPENFVRL